MDTQLPIPSPSTVQEYAKLDVPGILIFVLFIGLVIIIYAVRRFSVISDSALKFVEKQTEALTSVKDAVKEQIESQTRLHERIDTILTCPKAACPVMKMRMESPDRQPHPSPSPA